MPHSSPPEDGITLDLSCSVPYRQVCGLGSKAWLSHIRAAILYSQNAAPQRPLLCDAGCSALGVLTTISTCKRTIPNELIILLNPVVHSFRPMICGPWGLCHLTELVLDASMMDCMVAWEALGSFP